MPATKTQLVGGHFQDAEGNILVLGYLLMKLAQDANITGVGNVAAGVEIKILLDNNGSVAASPVQAIWGVDQMLPVNNYYRVTGYTAAGQPAWGPNNQQVIGSGGTFDVGTWVPNQLISWTPTVQSTELAVNGVPNANQTLFNLESTDHTVTITDAGNGNINLQVGASTPTGPRPNISPSGWHYLSATAYLGSQTSGWSGVGINLVHQAYSTGATTTGLAATATEPIYVLISNAGAPGLGASSGFLADTGNHAIGGFPQTWGTISIPLLKDWQCKTIVGTSFNQARTWVGIMDDNAGGGGAPTIMNTDSPSTFNFIGFRYAPATAGDQHWQIFVGGVSLTPVIIDTGIAVDGSDTGHVMEIAQTTQGTLRFLIDGVQVGSVVVSSISSVFTNMFLSYLWADNNNNTTRTNATNYGFGAWVMSAGNVWQAINSGTTQPSGADPLPGSPSPAQQIVDGSVTWQFFHFSIDYPSTRVGLAYLYWE